MCSGVAQLGGTATWEVVGFTLGAVVGFEAIVGLVYFWYRRRRERQWEAWGERDARRPEVVGKRRDPGDNYQQVDISPLGHEGRGMFIVYTEGSLGWR